MARRAKDIDNIPLKISDKEENFFITLKTGGLVELL